MSEKKTYCITPQINKGGDDDDDDIYYFDIFQWKIRCVYGSTHTIRFDFILFYYELK